MKKIWLIIFFIGNSRRNHYVREGGWRYAWQPPKEQKVQTVKTQYFQKVYNLEGVGDMGGDGH